MTRRLLIVAVLALALVAGLVGYGTAQVVQVKHFACHAPRVTGGNPWVPWQYLPNGADPCPSGWTKIDWVDD